MSKTSLIARIVCIITFGVALWVFHTFDILPTYIITH